jgi:hypothetical protein
MIVPPASTRREVDRNLVKFFRTHRPGSFRRAVATLCRFYNVRAPKIRWYEYIDWGKTAGKTHENGRIDLVHPEAWKRGRVYKSERKWVQMIYHEMAHYLFWTDAERKADLFSRRMVTGIRPLAVRGRQRTIRRGFASARRALNRAGARPRRAGPLARRRRGRAASARRASARRRFKLRRA